MLGILGAERRACSREPSYELWYTYHGAEFRFHGGGFSSIILRRHVRKREGGGGGLIQCNGASELGDRLANTRSVMKDGPIPYV